MHSAKPFLFFPSRSFFICRKYFIVRFVCSQSLAYKTEIQHANCRPLYPNRIEGGWPLCRGRAEFCVRPRAKFGFSVRSRGLFSGPCAIPRPWVIPPDDVNRNKKLNPRGRVSSREFLMMPDDAGRTCHEIIRTRIFPCIVMRIHNLRHCGYCKFNDVSLRSAFGLMLSRASLRLHNLTLYSIVPRK